MERVLYAVSISALNDPDIYEKAFYSISASRKEKTDLFRIAADRQRSVAAELLIIHALRSADCDPDMEKLNTGESGKPFLPDCPVQFNLSHSGEWVICAVSEQDVGCDIQEMSPIDLKIGRRFHPAEYDSILELPTEEQKFHQFYRLWTLKEAFLKVTGLGFSLPLGNFQLVCNERASVIQQLNQQEYHFYEFPDFDGYQCAVCAAGKDEPFRLETVSIEQLL